MAISGRIGLCQGQLHGARYPRGLVRLAQPMNVLIVEDEADIAELIQLYLTNENFTTEICTSGTDALKIGRAHV